MSVAVALDSGGGDDDLDETTPDLDPAGIDWARVVDCRFALAQRFTYAYSAPIADLRQRLVVLPRMRHGAQLAQSGKVSVDGSPARTCVAARDRFGNTVHDIHVPHVEETVSFTVRSRVRRSSAEPHHERCTDAELRDLCRPTPLTMPDRALRSAAAVVLASGERGGGLARALCRLVHGHLGYAHDVTTVATTAAEVWALGSGVCQDFAHAMLALCRVLGMPARYVSGQLAGQGGSHAWVEVLLRDDGGTGAEVLAFDPTHDRPADLRYLTIAVGRDYADVMPTSGFYTGRPTNRLSHRRRLAVVAARMIPATVA